MSQVIGIFTLTGFYMKTLLLNARIFLVALLGALLLLAPSLAVAGELPAKMERWEAMEAQRQQLQGELGTLEREHQNFVRSIENLTARGGARREREALLRENLRTVEELEILQRQIRDLDLRQEGLRGDILEAIEGERRRLEAGLREAPGRARLGFVTELNALQEKRRSFSAPLPAADRARVESVLAMARTVQDGNPRAMLSAADELEDTEEQLLRRLEGLNQQIAQLERQRRVRRRSESFSEVNRFFDEDQRNRRIGSFEVASSTPRGESTGPASGGAESGGEESRNNEESQEDFSADAEGVQGSDDGLDESTDWVGSEDGWGENEPVGEESGFGPEPSEPEEQRERIELRDPGSAEVQDDSVGSERRVRRDLDRLLRERDEIEAKARELRREAEELRRRARE